MANRLRGRLNYSSVVATLALCVAVGGTAYAVPALSGSSGNLINACAAKKTGALSLKTHARCAAGQRAIAWPAFEDPNGPAVHGLVMRGVFAGGGSIVYPVALATAIAPANEQGIPFGTPTPSGCSGNLDSAASISASPGFLCVFFEKVQQPQQATGKIVMGKVEFADSMLGGRYGVRVSAVNGVPAVWAVGAP